MRGRETRGIQTALAVTVLALVAIICATLLFLATVPHINKEEASAHIPPPLIASSTILYDKEQNLVYVLLHLANPGPEYIELKNIIVEYCNDTVLKLAKVPKRNETLVPYGCQKWTPNNTYVKTLRVDIYPAYFNWKALAYLSNYLNKFYHPTPYLSNHQ